MAIFGTKKKTATKAVAKTGASTRDVTWVLKQPRITEKAALVAEKGVYVFNISPRATKADVAQAVVEAYKVTPVSINIAKEPSKKTTRRKRSGVTRGVSGGTKKAYVTLKKGDTIQFV
ncbi:MAG: ribosomal subunit protein large subunit ribosomal protein [Candidatus Parcubacteria bacterium]|jgi:large subunit ribosomal protein L23